MMQNITVIFAELSESVHIVHVYSLFTCPFCLLLLAQHALYIFTKTHSSLGVWCLLEGGGLYTLLYMSVWLVSRWCVLRICALSEDYTHHDVVVVRPRSASLAGTYQPLTVRLTDHCLWAADGCPSSKHGLNGEPRPMGVLVTSRTRQVPDNCWWPQLTSVGCAG